MNHPNLTSNKRAWLGAWLAIVVLTTTLILSSADTGCDVTNDPDIKYFDIRLPEKEVVPDQLTTYACQTQKIPLSMGESYHAVAFEPIIVNKDVMHHMLMFGCLDSIDNDPHACSGKDDLCRSFLVQWSMGIKGQICSYQNTGVRFGLDSFHSLSLQIHWNNANKSDMLTDSSGFRIYYTTRLRKFDVGNFQVGQNDLEIPPEVAHFPQSGSCSSDCTRNILNEPIYLTRAHIHLHYVGDGGILELFRSGQKVGTIVNDAEFDYNHPSYHNFDDPVQVLPGDELKLTCFYNTRDGDKFRNNTVYWGMGSDGEMCYAFITYYPLVHNFDQCIQFDKHDICSPSAQTIVPIGGCVFEGFTRSFKTVLAEDILKFCSESASIIGNISSSPSQWGVNNERGILCSEKCENARKIVTENPCMQNRLGHKMRRVYLPHVESWEKVKVILDAASLYCDN